MKVGIVGAGMVGSTAAYAMVMRGIGRDIVLVDKDQERSEAEASDILHAVPFSYPINVHAGGYKDLSGCQVVILAAGVAQKPGESRIDLLKANADIFRIVIPRVLEYSSEAILLVATNPVDILTHLTAEESSRFGKPSSQVIGSGTTLDTARFRALLGRHLGIDPHHVHAYVLGEHGDSEVLSWSLVTVGGIPLDIYCDTWDICTDNEVRSGIEDQVRKAAYKIIKGKGSTYYGIGSALARIVEVILRDQRALLTICTPVKNVLGVEDVTLSLPHLIGGKGILDTVPLPLAMSKDEEIALRESAETMKKAYRDIMNS